MGLSSGPKKQPEHHGKIGYLQYPKSLGCPGAPIRAKKNCRGAPTCWPLASPLRGLRCPASGVQEPSGHLVWWSSESYPRKKRTSTRVLRLVWNLGLNWNSSRSFGQLALGSWKTHPFRPVTTSFFPRGTSHSNGMNDLPSESWDFPELMQLMRGCSSLHWRLDGPDKASSERRLLLRWNIIGPIMRMKVLKNNHSGVWQQSPKIPKYHIYLTFPALNESTAAATAQSWPELKRVLSVISTVCLLIQHRYVEDFEEFPRVV